MPVMPAFKEMKNDLKGVKQVEQSLSCCMLRGRLFAGSIPDRSVSHEFSKFHDQTFGLAPEIR